MSLKRKHECCEDDDDHEIKKIKFNDLLFTNDYIQLILSFLDRNFIFRTCSLISKQFREQVINTPVTLHIRMSKHLEWIRNLPYSLNMTDLKVAQTAISDVLGWFVHHPPKHLKRLRIRMSFSGTTFGDGHVEKLCSIPSLSTLTSLHIGQCEMTNKGCSLIANCEHFQNLTDFSVSQSKCDEKGVEEIVTSKYMSNLMAIHFYNKIRKVDGILSNPLFLRVKKLDLSYCSTEKLIFPQMMPLLEDLKLKCNRYKPNDLVALEQTRNLTRLKLDRVLDDDGCKIISENQYLSKLTDLDLENVKITSKGLKYIGSSPYFKQLKSLNLEYAPVDNEGCKILAESENMRNLTSLKLGKGLLDTDGLFALFNSDNMSNLQSLSLQRLSLANNFGDMLIRSTFGKNLTSLTFIGCDLDILDVQSITTLDGLRQLNITNYHNHIEKACEYIASSSHMSNLTSLTLTCRIGDSGCLTLANSIYLTNLTTLNLSSNFIGVDGCEYFAKSQNFPNLTTFDLTYNTMSIVGLKKIQSSPYFKNLNKFYKNCEDNKLN